MPDVRDFQRSGDADEALIEALRHLPLRKPGHDDWPRLARALQGRGGKSARRRRVRHFWPLAAAATLALALVIPRSIQSPPLSLSPPPADGTDDRVAGHPVSPGDVDRLIARSQWLERLIAADALSPVAQDGDQLLLEQGLRERIHRIDAALAISPDRPRPALWRARVNTLTQLAEMRWADRQMVWAGDAGAPGATATSVLWSN